MDGQIPVRRAADFAERRGEEVPLTDDEVRAALESTKYIREACDLLNVSKTLIFRKFRHLLDERKRKSRPPSASVLGGRVCWGAEGYVMEHCPNHPKADLNGMVRQHRLVMEQQIGRYLASEEVVHHKNRVRTDNRPENLEIHTRQSHGMEHAEESRERESAPLTEDQVRKTLLGRTTEEAASVLGVHHQTLRNRFPGLLKTRKSPARDDDPEVDRLIREFAADKWRGYRELAKAHGISSPFAKSYCQRHGIHWVKKTRATPPVSAGGDCQTESG